MTKLLIFAKNEKNLIEITEEDLRQTIKEVQDEAYNEGFQLGYLRGRSVSIEKNNPSPVVQPIPEPVEKETSEQGECLNDKE